jgi:hypothetical protein
MPRACTPGRQPCRCKLLHLIGQQDLPCCHSDSPAPGRLLPRPTNSAPV